MCAYTCVGRAGRGNNSSDYLPMACRNHPLMRGRLDQAKAQGLFLLILETHVGLVGATHESLPFKKGPRPLVRHIGTLVLALASQETAQAVAVDTTEGKKQKIRLGDSVALKISLDLRVKQCASKTQL